MLLLNGRNHIGLVTGPVEHHLVLMDDVIELIQFHEQTVGRMVHRGRTVVIVVHGDPRDDSAVLGLPVETDDGPVLAVGDVHEITTVALEFLVHYLIILRKQRYRYFTVYP